MLRLLIFGAGQACRNFLRNHAPNPHKTSIVGIIDNDSSKQGKRLEGYQIYSVMEGIRLPFDKILMLGSFGPEKKAQLARLGISDEQIIDRFNFYEYRGLFSEQSLYVVCSDAFLNAVFQSKKYEIALFTHNFTYNGGTIALLRLAQVLIKLGKSVLVISPSDGPSRIEFLKKNISVIIDCNLNYKTLKSEKWFSSFSLIFVNTLSMATLLQETDIGIPIVWWLHDPEETYQNLGFRSQNLDLQGIDVYAAGDIGWDSFAVTYPTIPKQILMYGIPEMNAEKNNDKKQQAHTVFAMIGTFNSIKAQDILLDAIGFLSEEKQEKCEFWLIGNNETWEGEIIKKRAADYASIKIMGIKDRAQMKEAFQSIDVVITPSRTDIMPIVNGEAMMNSIPCIVGENVGTAKLIEHEINGLIFKARDAKDLARKIEWVIDHRDRIPQMGKEARKVYEKYYSMESFDQRVLRILEKHGIR